MTFLDLLARQERGRAAWLAGERDTHPEGVSGEERDVIPSILDQGYFLPVRRWQLDE